MVRIPHAKFKNNPSIVYQSCIKLWTDLGLYLKSISDCDYFSKYNLLFGIKTESVNSFYNKIILVTKKYIWMCRFNNTVPNFIHLKNYLHKYICNLKMIYYVKNKPDMFEPIWNALYLMISQDV